MQGPRHLTRPLLSNLGHPRLLASDHDTPPALTWHPSFQQELAAFQLPRVPNIRMHFGS